MAIYESDLTKFMREYLKEHPEEVASQKKGRLIWWDKDPSVRTPPDPARHSPRSGGAEYTFEPLSEKDDVKKEEAKP
ncbi:MAG TPA: DUF3460 family protein [Burkholderiales bacterium]|nr:DUF3460 family protein [Burkholderiales bacterium]